MQFQPTADATHTRRRATPPPPPGNVHGLGVVDALRIELQPAQVPWLADEIDTLRYCLEDELEHARRRYDELPETEKHQRSRAAEEAEQEVDRRAYQLEVLAMIRAQLPISREATAAAVRSPWDTPAEEVALHEGKEPIAVVGPAALMTVLVRGVTRHAADALSQALCGPKLDVDHYTESGAGWCGPELPPVAPRVAEKLRAMATALHAFTDTYLHVLAQQTYSFDPEYRPLRADELE